MRVGVLFYPSCLIEMAPLRHVDFDEDQPVYLHTLRQAPKLGDPVRPIQFGNLAHPGVREGQWIIKMDMGIDNGKRGHGRSPTTLVLTPYVPTLMTGPHRNRNALMRRSVVHIGIMRLAAKTSRVGSNVLIRSPPPSTYRRFTSQYLCIQSKPSSDRRSPKPFCASGPVLSMFYIVVIATFSYDPLTICEESMSFSLSERRALVIGAGGGIGEVTSQVLAGLGAQVALVDRVAPKALADRIAADGGSA